MSAAQDSRNYIIWWSNTFPLDKRWREKHKVAFGSPQHRAMCQLDIMLEFIEERVYEDLINEALENDEKKKNYDSGVLIKPKVTSKEEENKAFEALRKIDFSKIKF